MRTLIIKLNRLIDKKYKKELIYLFFYLLLGMLTEMFGLGIILPILSILTNPNIANENHLFKILSNFLGNPTYNVLVIEVFILLILIYIFKSGYLLFLNWKQAKLNSNITKSLSDKLFWDYLKVPYIFHIQNNSAKLLRNIQSEVAMISAFIQSILYILTEFATILGIAIVLFYFEPVGALSVTIILFLFAFIFFKSTKKMIQRWGKERQYLSGVTNQYILQGLGGIRDVKILENEAYFYNLFSNENKKIANNVTKTKTLEQAPRLFLELLAIMSLAFLIFLMIFLSRPISNILPILGIFVASAFRLIPSVNKIMGSLQVINYSKPSIEVIYEELASIKKINKEYTKSINYKLDFKESIFLDNIFYKYPIAEMDVINGISLEIKKGLSIGIIGESGSGKSTLIDIITGLLIPKSGRILIDGKDVIKDGFSWQHNIGYVPQNIFLTDDSLLNNIAFGVLNSEINYQAVSHSINMAQLDKLIQDLPNGIQTFVGERGIRLSGGQKQRIGIARALYNNPEILILDEATSALDNETEIEVMKCINELHGVKTLIIIAHRYTTVQNCDLIYKIHNGRIIKKGLPNEILNIN